MLDPLAEGFDGASLAALLADPAVEIVVHAGRQDIALARRVLATEVTNVFDTQVAAGFAGMGAQSSYERCSRGLGVRVAKSASFTRWDRRPLSAEQLSYAREDVEHLLELATELERRLDRLGRLEWAREECVALAALERRARPRDDLHAPAAGTRAEPLLAADRARARAVARGDRRAPGSPRAERAHRCRADGDRQAKATLGGELEQIRGSGASNLRRRGEELVRRRGGA